MAEMKIAVVIPAYNEELTIKDVVKSFHRELPEAHIYVVDNNSMDNTNRYAQEAITECGCKGMVIFEKRQGKANAVRRAFTTIDTEVYVLIDADSTYLAEDVKKLLKPVLGGIADMVVGDRFSSGAYQNQNRRLFHNFGNNLVKNIINLLFKAELKDIMSGYRVFNRIFVKSFPILCEGFEIETEMTLHALAKRFRVMEIPIAYKDRPEGSVSKLNTFVDGIRILNTILMIFKNYRPLTFFGMISFCCFLSGLAIGLPVIMEFYETHYITKVPSSILASGLMILSAVFLTIGLILNTITHLHNFHYELSLLNGREKKSTNSSTSDR